ncbi:sensor histidine kinase [Streptomyces sp. NPDC058735]|uniref:sensor histidine kinase n=1 Tax=Streptomyces sp. NPDC058735 TaxID=3346616 RepID=UPI0036CE244A
MERFRFSVDTHLFRELGELLVGRDSTALIELIKNSYDADATFVRVRGTNLKNSGSIVISDDGVGMTDEIFRTAFLRIAGRYKEGRDRRSPVYKRRYTGAKGVGRLSAHKLARELNVESIPDTNVHSVKSSNTPIAGVSANINWDELESQEQSLESVDTGLSVSTITELGDKTPGTTLRLKNLKTSWTPAQLTRFLEELHSARPAEELLKRPQHVREASIIGDIRPASTSSDDPGFKIITEGDFRTGESLWSNLVNRAHWLLEIDASGSTVKYSIQPTEGNIQRGGAPDSYYFEKQHPNPDAGPFFTARIYAREGAWAESRASELTRFNQRRGGIRVYLEGFRVLPYGGRRDDWLALDRDYARKPRSFDLDLDSSNSSYLPQQENEGFLSQGNEQYVGAVFLTADGAQMLRPVVNREGFVEDESFEVLRNLVRGGIDLVTRARASRKREQQAEERRAEERDLESQLARKSGSETPATDDPRPAPTEPQTPERNVRHPLVTARQELVILGESPSIPPDAKSQIQRAQIAVELAENRERAWDEERIMLRVLAGVGLQFSAFVHEINGILGQANAVRELTTFVAEAADFHVRKRMLSELSEAVEQLVQSLTRQSSYLTDVVGPDARRRRRRMRLPDTVQASVQLLSKTLTERSIRLETQLDPYVKTPPIFPAEMAVIMTNLLTNAIKAADTGGTVLVSGRNEPDGGISLRVENTGTPIDLSDSEKWFRPFESTTLEVDVVLGQGLGLGLPITRRIVEEYRGKVRFVEPSHGFATAVEFFLPLPPRGAGA